MVFGHSFFSSIENRKKLRQQSPKAIDIVVTDNPHANRFTIHILAAVSEEHRRLISETTKVALQAAKARGVQLGKHGKYVLSKRNKEAADAFAWKVHIITIIIAEGHTTLQAIADELNRRGVPTARSGAQWYKASVCDLIGRLDMRKSK